MQRSVLPFLFTLLSAWATTAAAQIWKLDCAISSYSPHNSSGEPLEIAWSWLPETLTHVVKLPSSYHVEFGELGTAIMPPIRVMFSYRLFGEDGVAADLLYTYLFGNDIMTAAVTFGGGYNIDARGRYRSNEISEAEAGKLLP